MWRSYDSSTRQCSGIAPIHKRCANRVRGQASLNCENCRPPEPWPSATAAWARGAEGKAQSGLIETYQPSYEFYQFRVWPQAYQPVSKRSLFSWPGPTVVVTAWVPSIAAQSIHGVDARGAPGRNVAGD